MNTVTAGWRNDFHMPRREIGRCRPRMSSHAHYVRSRQPLLQPIPSPVGQVIRFANNCRNERVSPVIEGIVALYPFAAKRRVEIEPIAAWCIYADSHHADTKEIQLDRIRHEGRIRALQDPPDRRAILAPEWVDLCRLLDLAPPRAGCLRVPRYHQRQLPCDPTADLALADQDVSVMGSEEGAGQNPAKQGGGYA